MGSNGIRGRYPSLNSGGRERDCSGGGETLASFEFAASDPGVVHRRVAGPLFPIRVYGCEAYL